jgi:hypothetical protein
MFTLASSVISHIPFMEIVNFVNRLVVVSELLKSATEASKDTGEKS